MTPSRRPTCSSTTPEQCCSWSRLSRCMPRRCAAQRTRDSGSSRAALPGPVPLAPLPGPVPLAPLPGPVPQAPVRGRVAAPRGGISPLFAGYVH